CALTRTLPHGGALGQGKRLARVRPLARLLSPRRHDETPGDALSCSRTDRGGQPRGPRGTGPRRRGARNVPSISYDPSTVPKQVRGWTPSAPRRRGGRQERPTPPTFSPTITLIGSQHRGWFRAISPLEWPTRARPARRCAKPGSRPLASRGR